MLKSTMQYKPRYSSSTSAAPLASRKWFGDLKLCRTVTFFGLTPLLPSHPPCQERMLCQSSRLCFGGLWLAQPSGVLLFWLSLTGGVAGADHWLIAVKPPGWSFLRLAQHGYCTLPPGPALISRAGLDLIGSFCSWRSSDVRAVQRIPLLETKVTLAAPRTRKEPRSKTIV